MEQLDGKTSVATGGNGRIGLATAQQRAERGSHVFVTGRREAEVKTAVEILGADRATGIVGDVSRPEDLDRLYEAVRARGKGVDVLVANAGSVSSRRFIRAPRGTSTGLSPSTSGAQC